MRRLQLVLVLAAIGGGMGTSSTARSVPPPRQVEAVAPEVREFLQRVDAYVALHRRLEVNTPPEVITADVDFLFAPRRALARELRKARAHAAQGDLFTPAVSTYLGILVNRTLREHGLQNLLTIAQEEGHTVPIALGVNGDYDPAAALSFMPPCLLQALPRLPQELRYDFVGRALILWDVHAALIVDFAPRVLNEMTEAHDLNEACTISG